MYVHRLNKWQRHTGSRLTVCNATHCASLLLSLYIYIKNEPQYIGLLSTTFSETDVNQSDRTRHIGFRKKKKVQPDMSFCLVFVFLNLRLDVQAEHTNDLRLPPVPDLIVVEGL